MRLYAIGPVTGIEGDNIEAFRAAKKKLEATGHYHVAIPHDTIRTGTPWEEAMRTSIGSLICHFTMGVVLLDGWEESRGAMVERIVAEACGIPCKTVDEWMVEVVA